MSRAGIAVAGLGRIGRLHATNAAQRISSGRLVRVVDALEPTARDVGSRHGVPWSTSFDDVLDDPAVDGVVIATPTALHAEMVVAAARAGKHVLCEKPLGFDHEDSRAAVDEARVAGVSLQVGFQRRFDRDWVAMDEALRTGAIGPLRLLRCAHRNMREPEATATLGDLFVDVAIHDLDAARWIGGEVDEVFAFLSPGRGLESVIVLRFASGALGVIDNSRRAAYGFDLAAEVVGAQATLRSGYSYREGDVEMLRDGRVSAPVATDHARRQAAAYVLELEHFGAVAAGRATPRVDGEDGLAAFELAEAAARSAASGAPVRVRSEQVVG